MNRNRVEALSAGKGGRYLCGLEAGGCLNLHSHVEVFWAKDLPEPGKVQTCCAKVAGGYVVIGPSFMSSGDAQQAGCVLRQGLERGGLRVVLWVTVEPGGEATEIAIPLHSLSQ